MLSVLPKKNLRTINEFSFAFTSVNSIIFAIATFFIIINPHTSLLTIVFFTFLGFFSIDLHLAVVDNLSTLFYTYQKKGLN